MILETYEVRDRGDVLAINKDIKLFSTKGDCRCVRAYLTATEWLPARRVRVHAKNNWKVEAQVYVSNDWITVHSIQYEY